MGRPSPQVLQKAKNVLDVCWEFWLIFWSCNFKLIENQYSAVSSGQEYEEDDYYYYDDEEEYEEESEEESGEDVSYRRRRRRKRGNVKLDSVRFNKCKF